MSPGLGDVSQVMKKGDFGHSSQFEIVVVSFTKAVLSAIDKYTWFLWLQRNLDARCLHLLHMQGKLVAIAIVRLRFRVGRRRQRPAVHHLELNIGGLQQSNDERFSVLSERGGSAMIAEADSGFGMQEPP